MGPIIPDYKSHHESSLQVGLRSSPGYSAKSRFLFCFILFSIHFYPDWTTQFFFSNWLFCEVWLQRPLWWGHKPSLQKRLIKLQVTPVKNSSDATITTFIARIPTQSRKVKKNAHILELMPVVGAEMGSDSHAGSCCSGDVCGFAGLALAT